MWGQLGGGHTASSHLGSSQLGGKWGGVGGTLPGLLRDVGLVLISKLVTRNEEQRQYALSVVEQLEITKDYQPCVFLDSRKPVMSSE